MTIQLNGKGADIIVIGSKFGIKCGVADHVLTSECNVWYAQGNIFFLMV